MSIGQRCDNILRQAQDERGLYMEHTKDPLMLSLSKHHALPPPTRSAQSLGSTIFFATGNPR